jgi:DNA-directed RNA polymerase, mitochondrial
VVSLRAGTLLRKLGISEAAIVANTKAADASGANGGAGLVEGDEDADELVGAVRGSGAGRIDTAMESRFVDVVDLLPELPKKGDFKVETIKKSLYFFS